MLSRPYAFGCMLRLRTSSDFSTGHSVSNQNYESQLSFIPCCFSFHFIGNNHSIFHSMVISSLILSMKMFSTSFAVIRLLHMHMILHFPHLKAFPGMCPWHLLDPTKF